jgi:hypothetical protein
MCMNRQASFTLKSNYKIQKKKNLNKLINYLCLEDTFLLLDALEKDAEFLRNEIKPCICLEIGLVKNNLFVIQIIRVYLTVRIYHD